MRTRSPCRPADGGCTSATWALTVFISMFVTAALFFVSAVWTGAATSYPGLIIARLIGGIGVGGASVMAPLYISEISPPRIRGRMVATAQLAIVLGIVAAFFSNFLLANTGQNSWRYMFWAEGLPALAYFLLLFRVCPSPRWLVKVGRTREALEVIRLVDPEEDPDRVLNDIQQSLSQDHGSPGMALFRPPYLRLVPIAVAAGIFNQLTGINVVMYYAPTIFKSAGFAEAPALLQTVAVGTTNLLRLLCLGDRGQLFLLSEVHCGNQGADAGGDRGSCPAGTAGRPAKPVMTFRPVSRGERSS